MVYCVKCRTNTPDIDTTNYKSKNGRPMTRSKCPVCGTVKTSFIKSVKGKGIENARFAAESYKPRKQRATAIDGYSYDPNRSNRDTAVYINADKKAIIANRGTDLTRKSTRLKDLRDDALILIGKSDKIGRVKQTVKLNDELTKQGFDVTNTGHSLGSRVAYETSRRTNNPADLFSTGTSPFDRSHKPSDNITSYRTRSDPIAMNTSRLGVNDTIVPQTQTNPHTIDNFTGTGKKKRKLKST